MKNRMTETVEGFKGEVQQTMNKQIGTKDELVASIVQGLKKEAGVVGMLRPHSHADGTQDGVD